MKKRSKLILLLSLCLVIIQNKSINAQEYIKIEPINTLPLHDKLSIYEVGEIAVLEDNKILVSDRLIYKIYLIDNLKAIAKESGARGMGPAEFSVAPFKVTFDKKGQNIAVLDHTTPHINVYDKGLNFITRITNKLPPSDITYGDGEMLILGVPPTPYGYNSIFIYEKNKLINSFKVQLDYINIVYDNYIVDYLKDIDQIVIVYQNRNLIQFYTLEGALVREISIEDLPDLSESKEVNGDRIKKLPTNHIFTSISVDNNKVYILGNDYSKFPDRTIYVLTNDGTLLNKLVVGEPIRTIEVKDGILYTGNRRYIKKYSLNNEDIEE